MSYELQHNKTRLPKIASAAIVDRRAVTVTAGVDRVGPADADDKVLGVAIGGAEAAGDPVSVQIEGIVSMEASGAIAEGTLVSVDANGLLVAAGAADQVVGQLQAPAAAAGDFVPVLIDPSLTPA